MSTDANEANLLTMLISLALAAFPPPLAENAPPERNQMELQLMRCQAVWAEAETDEEAAAMRDKLAILAAVQPLDGASFSRGLDAAKAVKDRLVELNAEKASEELRILAVSDLLRTEFHVDGRRPTVGECIQAFPPPPGGIELYPLPYTDDR